jgi:hypothetical protein
VRSLYRPWEGRRRRLGLRIWPIARSGTMLVLKRWTFWGVFFLGLMSFLFEFSRIYLTGVQARLATRGQPIPPFLREITRHVFFDASGEDYREFMMAQSTVLMLLLGFAAPFLIGNDFRYRAFAFYFSKPIGRWHYFAGKLLAASNLAALLTVLPATVLFFEYGLFTESFDYYLDNWRILLAIVLTGALVSLVFSTILLGVASLLERTVPILVVWGGIFVFLPIIANQLRRTFGALQGGDPWAWGLIDPWSSMRWISKALFDVDAESYSARVPWAAATLGAWMAAAILVFWRRLRRVEVS